MIKELERETMSNIGYSVVQHGEEFFLVSTVNLPARRIESVMAEWRDDWWTPPYPNETMVWHCTGEEKDFKRYKEILHCAGYRSRDSALKNHQKLCRSIQRVGMKALNGREHQTEKTDKDRMPRGLFKDIERRTKGLSLR